MHKTILIVGAGPNQTPAIRMAKDRGYFVAVTDMDPKAEGFRLADDCGCASTRDPDATIAYARELHQRRPVSGVMTMASESAVTVARVAAALGLPGADVEAAWRATNKVARQHCWASSGICAPRFGQACTADEAIAVADSLGWPVVVKPVDSAGSRGVQKVCDPLEMDRAVAEIRECSSRPEILVEEFLQGSEHSIEGIVVDGVCHWVGFSDRNYDRKEMYLPHFLEDGDSLPTVVGEDTLASVRSLASAAVGALGIKWGPVKGDILIDATGPKMIEMAARLSGDYFCYETIPLHNGVDLLAAVMDQSMGEPVCVDALQPKFSRGVALRYIWPTPGEVTAIDGVEDVRSMPGVHFFRWEPRWRDIAIGSIITPARSMGERVGSVMVSAQTRQRAISLAEEAVRRIRVETKEVTAI